MPETLPPSPRPESPADTEHRADFVVDEEGNVDDARAEAYEEVDKLTDAAEADSTLTPEEDRAAREAADAEVGALLNPDTEAFLEQERLRLEQERARKEIEAEQNEAMEELNATAEAERAENAERVEAARAEASAIATPAGEAARRERKQGFVKKAASYGAAAGVAVGAQTGFILGRFMWRLWNSKWMKKQREEFSWLGNVYGDLTLGRRTGRRSSEQEDIQKEELGWHK